MADSWENSDAKIPEKSTSSGLSATAKSFSFNPTASSWAPSFTPAPPAAPVAAAVIAAPTPVPTPAPAPVVVSEEQQEEEKQDVVEQVTEQVQNVSVESTTPSSTPVVEKEEEVEEVEEDVSDEDPREHVNVVFIGHVDAGKSTLSGNILYLMDQVDKRTIERYEKEAKDRNRESWFLAFIMDTSEEERAKGKTVEVGRAHFETENKRFTILDAPGHKNYVPNMIQGAAQADVGILVISARKGEFETGFERGGQTREHAMLARTLGVNKLIVVINKMDEADWAQERFDECVSKLRPFLKGCGYAVKRDVTFIPISGLTGDNVKEKHQEKAPWYSGQALIPFLDELSISGRDSNGPLRVPVLDRYQDRGTVALGKVECGVFKTGAKLVVMPTGKDVTVNQVYINDEPVRTAKPGENITAKLSLSSDDIQKGFVLCDKVNPIKHVTTFIAQVALVDMLEHRPLFTAGYNAILHVHTITEECIVTHLLRPIDMKTGKPVKKRVAFVKQGSAVICRIKVEQSVSIETFEDMPQLGRFTLRDEGKTIGVGKILKLE